MRKLLNKLKDIEGVWSLVILVKDHWPVFGAVLSVFTTPAVYLWRYVEMTAVNVGWWVYPFFLLLVVSAVLGVFVCVLALFGKISIGGNKEWYNRRALAESARDLAQQISELNAEYISDQQQEWAETNKRLSEGGEFFSKERAKREDRITSRFALKFQSRVIEVASRARVFVPITRSDFWGLQQGLMSPNQLPEVILFLNTVAVKLDDARGQHRLEDPKTNAELKRRP